MEKFVNFIVRAAKDKDFHDSFDLSASTCQKGEWKKAVADFSSQKQSEKY